MHLHFHLDRFDGPLGLLLYLIRKEEMDIFDINIHEITDQYLNYIKSLKNLDLEMAGEFVAMAATLIHIKSKMLLPNYSESPEEDQGEDPRKALVQKLLEYEKFKSAAQQLSAMPLLNRDLWAREEKVDLNSFADEAIEVSERPLFSLIHAYRMTIGRVKKTVHRVGVALQSISQRINEIKGLLKIGVRREFGELVLADGLSPEIRQGKILITFLSLLELAKMGFINLFQNDKESPIYVDAKKEITEDGMIGMEDYENPNEKPVAAVGPAGVWDQLELSAENEPVEDEQQPIADATSEELQDNSVSENVFSMTDDFNPLNLMEMPERADKVGPGWQAEDAQFLKSSSEVLEESASDDEILAAELELEMLEKENSIDDFLSAPTEVSNSDEELT